jgi:uncharacterized protein (TIGR02453 family)
VGNFRGLTQGGLNFLQQLSHNNNKEWFSENREVYDRQIIAPLRDLVDDLAADMLAIDDQFEVRPSVTKTISRIHRDTRFSLDKSPYRSNVWIVFKRPRKVWTDSPVFFFEFASDNWRFGMGYYSASRETMNRLREHIADNPPQFPANGRQDPQIFRFGRGILQAAAGKKSGPGAGGMGQP